MNITQHITTLSRIAAIAVSTVLVKWGLSEDDATAAAVALIGIAIAGLTYLWSIVEKRKLLNTAPPPPSPDDERDEWEKPYIGAFLAPMFIVLLIFGTGCNVNSATVNADVARLEAVEPIIAEHVQRHPEQAQTWRDFVAAWRASIESRKSLLGPLFAE